MLTLRQRIFAAASIVVALLLAVILYMIYFRRPSAPANDRRPSGSPSAALPQPSAAATQRYSGTQPLPSGGSRSGVISEDVYLRQLAKIFVERFWSFSNQNGNRHIADSLELATPSMQAWMKSRADDGAGLYEGVTTEILRAEVVSKEGDKAVVEIGAQQEISQRTSTTTPTETTVETRTGRVELERVDGEWKVDALYWDK
ncbi:MAG: hypothetical protein UY92_C0009G0062 [Candidatus Magasanikbacteria bacterium GW2011_GWA2_56_11]|uniref:Uncharacterized protein n=1 Tax=Candidatus Magasanikbacteria bacterium GW2011_GWA2_56_11 TaxID=1619044 RepID=A0A0G1YFP9_9BACT|nr:MAG: hypothetical protein UY92_C0009G0062 [Candidatus Magasanikbacteria bacterium GW2011_GWA2_56_11]